MPKNVHSGERESRRRLVGRPLSLQSAVRDANELLKIASMQSVDRMPHAP